MSQPVLLRDILMMLYDPAKERADMELRQRLANEEGETIYPEPIGNFYDLEDTIWTRGN